MRAEFLTQSPEPVFVNVYGAQESIPPANVDWRSGTTRRVIVPARHAGNRFLGSFKGLQIQALSFSANEWWEVGSKKHPVQYC